MNQCICCGADADETYCPFCEELYDAVEAGDIEMTAIGDGAEMTAEREKRIALAYKAYDHIEERRGAYYDVPLGDGNSWRRAS